MGIEIKLPSLGEGVDEAEVLDVLVQEGDEIEQEQGIIEVETDKASAEVPATQAGRVESIHISVGDTIRTGDVLLTLTAVGSDEQETDEQQKETPADDERKSEETPQAESDGSREQVQTDEQRKAGVESGDRRDVEAPEEDLSNEIEASSDTQKDAQASPSDHDSTDAPPPASPSVRRFAREVEVDVDDVTGSGPGGRITRDDIKAEVAQHRTTQPPTSAEEDESPAIGEPASDAFGEVRVERLSKLQQTMARRMQESWTTIPRVTNFDDADITQLEQLRKASQADYAEAGIKLTVLPLIPRRWL